jgi:hypothetical protein
MSGFGRAAGACDYEYFIIVYQALQPPVRADLCDLTGAKRRWLGCLAQLFHLAVIIGVGFEQARFICPIKMPQARTYMYWVWSNPKLDDMAK